jgi:hypothetical protein
VTEDLRGQALGRFAARTNFIRGRRGDKHEREQS